MGGYAMYKTNPNERINGTSYMNEAYEVPIVMPNNDGLTVRQYFAAMAMQGLLATNATHNGKTSDRESLAKDAVAFADNLINALNTPTP